MRSTCISKMCMNERASPIQNTLSILSGLIPSHVITLVLILSKDFLIMGHSVMKRIVDDFTKSKGMYDVLESISTFRAVV